ncbi:hypothetical protein Tco_0638407 [Tanacetum coccineum]
MRASYASRKPEIHNRYNVKVSSSFSDVSAVIIEYLVKISKKARILELKQRYLKIIVLTTNTPYPSRKIRRICAYTSPKTMKETRSNTPMDNPKITMEEYIRLEEEKAQKRGKVFNWETAKYGKIWYDEEVHDLRSIETKFSPIVFNDNLTSDETLFCEPTPSVSCIDYLDFFKDFENEFPTIVYNDALTSKSDFSTEPTLCPQHINEFDLKDKTSLSEYDEVEQNVLYFNDLFTFNIIYPDDLKSDKDNDDNEIDMIQSSGGNKNTQGLNKLLEASHDKINKVFIMKSFVMKLNVNIMAWKYLVNGMLFNLIKNLYVPFGIPFDPKRYYKDGDPTRMLRRPRYQGMEYSDQDIADFEERLERIHDKGTHRGQVLDFEGMPELIRDVLYARMRMEHRDGDGVMVFTSQAWGRVFETRGPLVRELILEFLSTLRFGEVLLDLDTPSTIQFLGTSPSYTLIRDLVLRLYYRMMAHNIAGKSQAPEKVTVTDLFYLRGLDVRSVNIPYLLARYLRRVVAGRKNRALISGPARQEGDAGGVVEEASVAPCDNRMSTPVFAYLVETETPESPYTVASPTILLDSTPPTRHAKDLVDSDTSGVRPMSSDFTVPLSPDHSLTHTTPTLVPLLHTTTRMAVCVSSTMSPGLSASIAKVAVMSNSAFCKRFRSSYDSLPSSSPADLPSQKHYRDTSELVEVDEEEEDDEEEDEEIEESLDSDSESKGGEDEGLTVEDKDPAARDEGLVAGDEGPGIRVESLGLGEDAAVPEGQQRAAPIMETAVGEPLGLGYRVLRRREIALGEGQMPSVFEPTLTTWIDPEDGIAYIDGPTYPPLTPPVQTPPSLEWSSGLLPISLAPSIIPSPISSPMIPLTVPLHVASPATTKAEGFLTELGAQRYDGDIGELFTRSGEVKDEILSQRYQFRSLEYEPERVAVTFVAIWRPVLALESWVYQMDAQRAALWHAISDTQMENRELRLHIA